MRKSEESAVQKYPESLTAAIFDRQSQQIYANRARIIEAFHPRLLAIKVWLWDFLDTPARSPHMSRFSRTFSRLETVELMPNEEDDSIYLN
jgi:hypothetical protein